MGFDIPAQLDDVPLLFELFCEDADLRGIWLITVELLALLDPHSDFILGFLPDGMKLPSVLNFVLEDEFRLIDPLIQPADILPHSVAYIPGLLGQRPHLV